MRRTVFSFPFAVATFLIGIAAFAFADSTVNWFEQLLPLNVPAVAIEETPLLKIDVPSPSHRDEAEIREVYSVVLDEVRYKGGLIILEELTTGWPLGGDMHGVEVSTLEDYELRNREPVSLQRVLGDQKNIAFFTEKDARAVSRSKNIQFEDKFAKRFPGAHRFVSLSNVGFNSKGTEALVYASYDCGPLCGDGSFYVLQKKEDRWVFGQKISVWAS